MKTITLTLAFLASTLVAICQNVPCPDIQSHGYIGTGKESGKVFFFATGDVSAQKGVNVKVYKNSVVAANAIGDFCFIIPPNSSSAYYETALVNTTGVAQVIYVITRKTASNGDCQGGSCGVSAIVSGPLPVKIQSFTAVRNNNNVNINWVTSEEINAASFEIERNNGKGFETIGSMKATNKSTGSTYSYSDLNIAKSAAQYRIKMIDNSGAFVYTEIKTVKGSTASEDFTVYPNPSFGYTKVTVAEVSADVNLQLVDNSGRVVKTVSMSNKSFVEFNNLNKGMYMVRLINKATGTNTTKKLVVL